MTNGNRGIKITQIIKAITFHSTTVCCENRLWRLCCTVIRPVWGISIGMIDLPFMCHLLVHSNILAHLFSDFSWHTQRILIVFSLWFNYFSMFCSFFENCFFSDYSEFMFHHSPNIYYYCFQSLLNLFVYYWSLNKTWDKTV